MAHACADDHAGWPGGVAWLPMSEPASVETAVAAAGRALGIAGYDAMTLPEQLAATSSAWGGPERRLLVFDNCEDPALLGQWRPAAGGARVLLTARRTDWPARAARTLPIGDLPCDAAIRAASAANAPRGLATHRPRSPPTQPPLRSACS